MRARHAEMRERETLGAHLRKGKSSTKRRSRRGKEEGLTTRVKMREVGVFSGSELQERGGNSAPFRAQQKREGPRIREERKKKTS